MNEVNNKNNSPEKPVNAKKNVKTINSKKIVAKKTVAKKEAVKKDTTEKVLAKKKVVKATEKIDEAKKEAVVKAKEVKKKVVEATEKIEEVKAKVKAKKITLKEVMHKKALEEIKMYGYVKTNVPAPHVKFYIDINENENFMILQRGSVIYKSGDGDINIQEKYFELPDGRRIGYNGIAIKHL